MGDIKAKTYLEKLGFADSDKKTTEHDIIQAWVYKNIKTILDETIMSKNPKPYEITNVKWEHQIIYTNSYNNHTLIGFADLMVSYKCEFYNKHSESYQMENGEVIVEIKTKIPDLGSVIRQMRTYQTYQKHYRTQYLVVSPDDRFPEILKEQGFWFYKYNDPTKLF